MDARKRDVLSSGWLGFVELFLVDAILEAGTLRQFESGETIYGFGQPQDCLHGIASGLVQMLVTMNEQEPRFGHIAGPGFWFGETEVITGKTGIIEMTARGELELFSLRRKQIDNIAEKYPEIWPAITLLAVQNQGLAIGAADDLMIRNSRKRLAAVLLRLASMRNAYQEVRPLDTIPVSWNELSEAAGLSRSKVADLLSEFTKSGLLQTMHRRIKVTNADGLRDLLND